MRRVGVFALLVLAVVVIGGYVTHLRQDRPPDTPPATVQPGEPGSWQCIEHFGDQSRCTP